MTQKKLKKKKKTSLMKFNKILFINIQYNNIYTFFFHNLRNENTLIKYILKLIWIIKK